MSADDRPPARTPPRRRAHCTGALRAPARRALPAASVAALAILIALLAGEFASRTHGGHKAPPAPTPPRSAAAGPWPSVAAGAVHGQPVRVAVGSSAGGARVPTDFLGLSFESASLPYLASYARGGTLVALMRELGPGVLRIGGLSADKLTAWLAQGGRLPAWAQIALSGGEIGDIGALLGASGWRAILTANAAHFNPQAAAQEAASAQSLLGGHLLALSIGNEPDRYVREGLLAPGWSFAAYARRYRAYREAIGRTAPAAALAAPDASSGLSVLPWVRSAIALHPGLLTDHFYPLTACDEEHPTIAGLLSAGVAREEAALLSALHALSAQAHIPLRIDEANDISCHGEPGVSNTFASALWAVRFISRAMSAGLAGVNFHDLLAESDAYSPLVFAGAGNAATAADARAAARGDPIGPLALHANPEWYALLMTSALDGSTALPTSEQGPQTLYAQAYRAPDGTLRIVLDNTALPGSAPLAVRLAIAGGPYRAGSILRLAAPSPAASAAVSLGGAQVSAAGAWRPQLPLPAPSGNPSSPALELPPASAALLTLQARSAGS